MYVRRTEALRFTYYDSDKGLYVVRFYKNGVFQDSWAPVACRLTSMLARPRVLQPNSRKCQMEKLWRPANMGSSRLLPLARLIYVAFLESPQPLAADTYLCVHTFLRATGAKDVTIDDFFPTKYGQCAFASSGKKSEAWVQVLEILGWHRWGGAFV